MLVLDCEIILESKQTIVYKCVNNIEVVTSIRNLSDTARITLPRHSVVTTTDTQGQKNKEVKKLGDYVSVGDKVTIKTGYAGYPEHEKIFKGYVTGISNETPTVIEVENAMWLLKKTPVKPKRYEKFNLADFFNEYAQDIELIIPKDISFGEVIIKEETTVAKVLDYLRQNYPFNAFIIDGKLVAVLLTGMLPDGSEIKIKEGLNIISSTLKYTTADDVKIQIVAKSILADNTKIEAKSPADGADCEVRTFYEPSCKTVPELQEYADNQLAVYKTDRMTGDIVLFGVPSVKKGDTVIVTDRDNKKFIADTVKYSFGIGGYRQTITLGDEIK